MENIPSIIITIYKIWKKAYWLLHLLHNIVDNMENSKKLRPDPELRLMDQVRQVLRYHHYAYRTEQTYCDWIMRCIRHHGSKTHPLIKSQVEAA